MEVLALSTNTVELVASLYCRGGCDFLSPYELGIVPNGANYAISQLTLSPRSHAPRGNAVPDAPRPRADLGATQSVEHGIPTRSMGTRGRFFPW